MEVSEYLNAGILAVNVFVLILGFASFVGQARQNRKVQQAQIENQQIEIYQRLETQSSDVFAFEAANRKAVTPFKSNLAPAALSLQGEDLAGAQLTVRKYYEISCNLFEVASRLRRKDIVDHEVFASWGAWFFDTASEWGFRALWHDMRENYTTDLRDIFDSIVDELIASWDVPHASGQFGHYEVAGLSAVERTNASRLAVSEAEQAEVRKRFYAHLAKVFDCPAIADWLKNAEISGTPVEHPLAFR